MKSRVLNGAIVVAVISFLSILAFYVRIGDTADSVVVLRAAGMTCGSCSEKIGAALKREKGVAVTEVDVNNGLVIVGYDTKKTRPETIAARVSRTGYESSLYAVLTPDEFKKAAGREIGKNASSSGGCGGCASGGGGCGGNKSIKTQGV